MPPTNSNLDEEASVHSFQKVDGFLSIEIRNALFEGPVVAGDIVDVFVLPGGRALLSKHPDGIRIKEINSVYIIFDTDVNIIEN